MAFTIVQIFLALLLAVHVCMCTKQGLNRISAGVVRQIDNLNNLATNLRDLDNEGTRRKRSLTITYRRDITDAINGLRSNVGASDMNYLTKSSSIENDVVNWTSHCNYDAEIYTNATVYAVRFSIGSPPDYVSLLSTVFNTTDFYYALRSVELRFVAAAYSYCPDAIANGQNHTSYYVGAYLFSITSNFTSTVPQYTLGEACTTCLSGSYWCYQGALCKDDCSASDSNCYCNSYCLNCATTISATCRCQCLEGWTGSRCDSNDGTNATEPTCITTPRNPITKSISTPTTIKAPTTTKATTTTNSGMNVVPIGKSMIQLSLYTTIALLLRVYNNVD